MHKRVDSWLAVLVLAVFLTSTASAVRVGVVVELPEGNVLNCIFVDEDTNGYDVLRQISSGTTWSAPGPWGHGLCAIGGVGCPSSNCFFCDASEGGTKYWNFYIKKYGKTSWSYSPVGFDGGSTCSEHYCAKEGDVLGFAYGGFGSKPPDISFNKICSPPKKKRIKNFDISILPGELFAGNLITIMIEDISADRGIRKAEVEVFKENIGSSGTVFSGETDREGRISFRLNDPRIYKLRVRVRGYDPSQKILEIDVKAKIPETTTSTTTTTTTIDSCAGVICPTYYSRDTWIYDGKCWNGTCVYKIYVRKIPTPLKRGMEQYFNLINRNSRKFREVEFLYLG